MSSKMPAPSERSAQLHGRDADNQKSSGDLLECHREINNIDSMCQIQLGQISAVTSTLLLAIETADFWRHPDRLVDSLGLIQYLAEDLMNFVNVTAESVGCNYVDEVERARSSRVFDAFRRARVSEVANG